MFRAINDTLIASATLICAITIIILPHKNTKHFRSSYRDNIAIISPDHTPIPITQTSVGFIGIFAGRKKKRTEDQRYNGRPY